MWSRRPILASILSIFTGGGVSNASSANLAPSDPLATTNASKFTQGGSAAVIRDFQAKMREQTSVKDFGGSDSEAWNAAVKSGAKDILIPRGDYGFAEPVIITGDGISLRGESDCGVNLRATGSQELFIIGSAREVIQHIKLNGFSFGADNSFSGSALIRVKRGFQIYFDRLRYKYSSKSPTQAVYVFDNEGGEEQPVRITIRDCYIDGADYNPRGAGGPAPIGFWNTGGIQALFENTHIQDCQIGWKLGVNLSIDKKYVTQTDHHGNDFYDLYITNNCRYQVGDRGGTNSSARALDIWQGSGVHLSQSQFYLNNNGPNPPLADQRIAVFNHSDFGVLTLEQCTINGNARTDYFFETAPGAGVRRLALGTGNEWGGLVGGKGLIKKGAGSTIRAIIDPSNSFDNPNNFGPVDQRTNTSISSYDLGLSGAHYYQANDGTEKSIAEFRNGTIGQIYIINFEISGRSSVSLTSAGPTSAEAMKGVIVDGFLGGRIQICNGDMLIVTRGPLAAAEYYRAKLIRGGALVASILELSPSALPSTPGIGQIMLDEADGKYKAAVNGKWHTISFDA